MKWLILVDLASVATDNSHLCNSPNDISYVFSGYAPLSIRLAQHVVRSGWVADGHRSLVLVVFIGVTFAEISALRFLSAQEGMAYDLIVGMTKMINGHSVLETFMDNAS